MHAVSSLDAATMDYLVNTFFTREEEEEEEAEGRIAAAYLHV